MRNGPPLRQRLTLSKETAIAIATLLIMTAVPLRLAAEQVVLHRFIAKVPDRRVEELLYLAAGVQLMREGLTSTREGGGETYILLTDYAVEHGALDVRYTLVRPDAPDHPLASVARKLSIDQTLDEKVASAVVQLLRTANIETAPSPQAEIRGLLPKAPKETMRTPEEARSLPPAAAPVQPPAANVPPRRPSTQPAAAPPEPTPPASAPAGPVILPAPRAAPHNPSAVRFDSSVSAAGVLFFGRMTEYFHYGLAGQLTAGLVWPMESWSFGLGARISAIRVFNDFGVVGGPLYLSTAGLNLQVGTGTKLHYRATAGLSGGAALITVASSQGVLDQLAPYADVGARAAIPIGGPFFLGAEVRFLTIIDKGLLILGVTPAVDVSIGP